MDNRFITGDIKNSKAQGTCCLVGPDIVLTAAHMVYSTKYGNASSINVAPAQNGYVTPYGTFTGTAIFIHEKWKNGADPNYDWAIVKIKNNDGSSTVIGNTIGYFYPEYLQGDSLNGISVFVTGYPIGDKEYGTMWRSGGAISATRKNVIYYDCDTAKGDSGTPVTNSSNKIIGIHRGPDPTQGNNVTENCGVRITDKLISFINTAIDELGW